LPLIDLGSVTLRNATVLDMLNWTAFETLAVVFTAAIPCIAINLYSIDASGVLCEPLCFA
jgi:hypothetical protein